MKLERPYLARNKVSGPQVTAIIPVYPGNKKTIKHCLDNVARQTYPLNILVLLNNSREGFIQHVIKLCKNFSRHSIHTFTVQDLGKVKGMATDIRVTKKSGIICQVINAGYDLSESAYNILVPADVLLPNMAIELMLQTFEERSDAGVVCLTCYMRNPFMNVPMVLPKDNLKTFTPEDYIKDPIYEAKGGNGAMMVPYRVYKTVRWRTFALEPHKVMGADYLFCVDVKDKLNLKTYIRTDMEVIHMDPDGKTIYFSGRVPIPSKKVEAARKEHEKREADIAGYQ